MMNSRKKESVLCAIAIAVLFLFLFLFFTQMHPLQIFNGDDWTYIARFRDALPDVRQWNPTRLLPETLMPLCGSIGAFLVTPMTGDYLSSLSLVCALVVCLFITAYVVVYYWAIQKLFAMEKPIALLCSFLFFVAHFLVFRSKSENNLYLFFSTSTACYFFYTLPVLLNAVLVMFFERNRSEHKALGHAAKGMLLLACYLALYSNIFSSVVLAVYAGVTLLLDGLESLFRRERRAFVSVIRRDAVHILILAAWFICLYYEKSGGRADNIGVGLTWSSLKKVVLNLLSVFPLLNRGFVGFSVVVCVLSLLLLAVSRLKAEEDRAFLRAAVLYVLCAALTAIYLVLLCANGTLTSYIKRADVLIAIFFFVLLGLTACLGYLFKKLSFLEISLPVLILIAAFQCCTTENTFKNPYVRYSDPQDVRAITKTIYRQVVDAYNDGQEEITLFLPDMSVEGNWPLPVFLGSRIADALLVHGQTPSRLQINVVVDDAEFNRLLSAAL